jgi:uncharacterized protein YjbJ (UPF0337 family)
MSDPENTETTAGGVLGRVVGKAKAAVGGLVGNDDLKREGNLQQAQSEAELIAERETEAAEQRKQRAAVDEQRTQATAERGRLEAELEAEERKENIERNEARAEASIAAQAAHDKAIAETREELQQTAADAAEQAALRQRAADAAEAARLEQQAKKAELTADAIDPEAK